jgi:hypothetical protein
VGLGLGGAVLLGAVRGAGWATRAVLGGAAVLPVTGCRAALTRRDE